VDGATPVTHNDKSATQAGLARGPLRLSQAVMADGWAATEVYETRRVHTLTYLGFAALYVLSPAAHVASYATLPRVIAGLGLPPRHGCSPVDAPIADGRTGGVSGQHRATACVG
jgi:hypothetical protein